MTAFRTFAITCSIAALGPLLSAQLIPNRYIVEFSGEPVALRLVHEAKTQTVRSSGFTESSAKGHRKAVQSEQTAMRSAIQAKEHVAILHCVDLVSNACFLRMTADQALRVAQMPGVKRVRQEQFYKPTLDRATQIHRTPDVWSAVGFENAGRGAKIAMIDSGIDNNHPGFQDPALPVAEGFPQADNTADRAYTNNKIIVARSYVRLLAARDPDLSARDRVGHGTSTAMAAAGVTNTGPLATITGMAPKAYLGNYKVFGSPGVNDNASSSALLSAINDAVDDGMQVLNLSLGAPFGRPIEDDSVADALYLASLRDVVVVVSAGNDGPNLNTIENTGGYPSVITVGAVSNDRAFVGSAAIDGIGTFAAVPAFGSRPSNPISAPLVDVGSIDGSGLACDPLPSGSLSGNIALIPRNPDKCPTATKLRNAQTAGAVAGLLYNTPDQPDLLSPFLGPSLPAEILSYPDGIKVQQAVSQAGRPRATLDFQLRNTTFDPLILADFTSKGPGPGGSIKPDLLAVGRFVYTAAQSTDPKGDGYSADGYVEVDGTSFSAPLVAGAAALLKSARPGLTAAQYKSLLINNAAPFSTTSAGPINVQQGGAGLLDAFAACRGTITAEPASLSFGVQGQTVNLIQTVAITNLATAPDTLTISVSPGPSSGVGSPLISAGSLQLAPGGTQNITLDFSKAPTLPGAYQGVIRLQSNATGAQSRIPYFYAVPSAARHIQILRSDTTIPVKSFDPFAALFRIVDENGVALKNTVKPTGFPVSGGGAVLSINLRDQIYADAWALNVRMGPDPGPNVFRIVVGDVTQDVTIVGVPGP